ncbi:MAG: hypothetical protein Q7S74_04100 [Nanoarchaeota archaeon]|nr:hypothetical protein [Nanoarchaeota archaeon]
MILERHPQTLAEVQAIVLKLDEKQPLKDYLKKVTNLSKEKAEKLKQELKSLKNTKLREEYLVKIIDFLPKDSEDLNKIFSEAMLTEDEINPILEIVRKY